MEAFLEYNDVQAEIKGTMVSKTFEVVYYFLFLPCQAFPQFNPTLATLLYV